MNIISTTAVHGQLVPICVSIGHDILIHDSTQQMSEYLWVAGSTHILDIILSAFPALAVLNIAKKLEIIVACDVELVIIAAIVIDMTSDSDVHSFHLRVV